MDVTCALLVTTPDKNLLIVHPTNSKHFGGWSLPKGIRDPGETSAQAAARECFEETGLDFRDKISEFIDLKEHQYISRKNFHLFHYKIDDLSDVLFECTTHFIDRKGKHVVEVDQHKVVSLETASKLLNPKQYQIIINSLETD